ncbi:hypothetical protein BDB00DRAFT_834493 [Zychaea mexicana]|uniref:uncharacterized protein n=1 Tax=Zychaea mexicana TaxID=64656 RepID=UPI0022FE7DD6|nr:uncharacterized protein BDB00DRAFT_834493 [Zychaea mexicana]KAI9491097.1 hypothetical protein BDB00DRAFT_834493 [Zychaea mexicana]
MSADDEEANLITEQRQTPSKSEQCKTVLIWIWRVIIFAITGSSSVAVTRSIMQHILGMTSPDNWVYYALFFVLELIVYTVMIVVIGSCLGQWRFFCLVACRMWGWLLPAQIRETLLIRLQSD